MHVLLCYALATDICCTQSHDCGGHTHWGHYHAADVDVLHPKLFDSSGMVQSLEQALRMMRCIKPGGAVVRAKLTYGMIVGLTYNVFRSGTNLFRKNNFFKGAV